MFKGYKKESGISQWWCVFHSSLNDTGKEDILNYIESLLIKEEKIEEE